MKHSKQALKQIFGSPSEGLKYMETVFSKQKSPILFVEGPGAAAFAEWMSSIISNHAILDHETFNSSHQNKKESLLIVKDVDEIHDGTIQAAVAARDNYKNVVVASKKHSKMLDFVSDPAFKVLHVDTLNIADLKAEVSSLLSAFS